MSKKTKKVLVLDTETTGLTLPSAAPLELQPRIIEICGVELLDGEIEDVYHDLVNPGIPISTEITGITGITDEMVEGKPKWEEIDDKWRKILREVRVLVAHNLTFDLDMIRYEQLRTPNYPMPFPHQMFCTVEQTQHLKGYRLKLFELYNLVTGKEMKEAHRAEVDTMALVEVYQRLREQGLTQYYD